MSPLERHRERHPQLERHRPERRHQLTVADGFRIGIGIAFWHVVVVMILYSIVFVGMLGLGLLTR